MRESWWELLLSSIAALFVTQSSFVNQENPENVVHSVFEMARQQKTQEMHKLCDPEGRNDGDTDCLCALSSDYIPHSCPSNSHNRISQSDFATCFSTAKIAGPVRYMNAEEPKMAVVPFSIDPKSCWGKSGESFELLQLGNKWYLASF